MGRARAPSVGLAHAASRSARSADLRFRSRRCRRMGRARRRGRRVAHAARRPGPRRHSSRPPAARDCTSCCRFARRSTGTTRKGSPRPIADLMVRDVSRPLYRGDVEVTPQGQRSSSTTCATPRARPRLRPMRCARGPTRRWRRRSPGRSSRKRRALRSLQLTHGPDTACRR